MNPDFYIASRGEALAATHLIAQFGSAAQHHAAARANASRALGNLWDFCRWRQIERLIAALTDSKPGTLH